MPAQPVPLLFLFLRHAALRQYLDSAAELLAQQNPAGIQPTERIEAELLAGFADALGGYAGGKFQFFEASGAEFAAIEADQVVLAGIEAQPAMRDVLEGDQQLGLMVEKQRGVWAIEIDGQIGGAVGSGRDGDFVGEFELHLGERQVQETAELGFGFRGVEPKFSAGLGARSLWDHIHLLPPPLARGAENQQHKTTSKAPR